MMPDDRLRDLVIALLRKTIEADSEHAAIERVPEHMALNLFHGSLFKDDAKYKLSAREAIPLYVRFADGELRATRHAQEEIARLDPVVSSCGASKLRGRRDGTMGPALYCYRCGGLL